MLDLDDFEWISQFFSLLDFSFKPLFLCLSLLPLFLAFRQPSYFKIKRFILPLTRPDLKSSRMALRFLSFFYIFS